MIRHENDISIFIGVSTLRRLCRHVWIEADKRTYDLKCERCGIRVKQAVMDWPQISVEDVAPTVAPMTIDFNNRLVGRELTRHLTENLTKRLYK